MRKNKSFPSKKWKQTNKDACFHLIQITSINPSQRNQEREINKGYTNLNRRIHKMTNRLRKNAQYD
jgi:hypothetical protein